MTRKAQPKRACTTQKRLSPDDRRKEFVKATEFFAEQGFGGGTRDLTRRLGVTQPLIFYYGVRKYIYESLVLEDKERMISDALDAFLAGYVFGAPIELRRAPMTVVR
jgi:AcrR family transcriptional regulator